MDINEEYLRIFGTEERPTLYAPDDKDYMSLRQEIIDAPREFNVRKILPFEGIQLLSYEDYLNKEVVKEAEKKGYRIFYIKKHEQEKLVFFAAGYYNAKDSRFVVLARSFFKSSFYFTQLSNSIKNTRKKLDFLGSFKYEGNKIVQMRDVVYDSASLAASYILGEKRSFSIWRDDRGRTLDAYYPIYRAKDIIDKEDSTFPNYTPKVPETPINPVASSIKEPIGTILNAINEAKKKNDTVPFGTHRIFYIKIEGVCDVSGYYVESSKRFIVLQGSSFKNNTSKYFDETPIGISRMRFIEAACFTNNPRNGQECVVSCDTRCKSASAAASYVLGRVSSYMSWKDANGKTLKDWYPNDFNTKDVQTTTESASKKPKEPKTKITISTLDANVAQEKNKVAQEMPSVQLFYIKKSFNAKRDCDAFGYYDPRTQKFILKEGSYLAIEMTDSYKFTAAGYSRRNFTSKYCKKDIKGYRLKYDYLFDTTSTAASYVLGRAANGWTEWKNAEDVSLAQTL